MKKLPLFVLIGLTLLMQTAYASLGFEENTIFVDHENVTILEKVENELRNPCLDCDVFLTLTYPNNSLFVVQHMNMTLLNNTGHYNSSAISNMTTIGCYPISIVANRTSSGIFNGTSDRNVVCVQDVYPTPQSNWEVGIVGALLITGFIFIYLSNNIKERLVQLLFFLLGITMPLVILGLSESVLIVNLGNSNEIVTLMHRIFITYAWAYLFFIGYIILIIIKSLVVYIQDTRKVI